MKFKKTRVAFSLFCGILCLALIALWVRSYWMRDWLGLPGPGQNVLFSMRGTIKFQHWSGKPLLRRFWWQHTAESTRGLSDFLDVPMLRLLGSRHPSTFYGPYFGFIYERHGPGSYNIYVRMRALAMLTAILALVPWLPWSLWLMRFNLRTLLLFITLIALLLGWIMCFARL